MKKGIIVLLVAVLAAGFAFASFSGNAKVGFKFDLDEKDYGFSNTDSTKVDLVLAEDKIEVAGDSDIYAAIKANFQFRVAKAKTTTDTMSPYRAGVIAKITEAKIYGSNWSIDITGAKNAYDYAKSAMSDGAWAENKDPWGEKNAANYSYYWDPKTYAAPVKKAPGVTVTYDGYTFSFGLSHDESASTTDFSVTAQTKSFKLADDAITVQAAAEIGQKESASSKLAAGFSAKASYEKDKLSTSAAFDLGLEELSDEAKVKFDTAVAAAYDFVSADIYFAKTTANYLSAAVGFDLNSFDVPATITVEACNIICDDSDIDLAIDATFDGIENVGIEAGFSTNLKDKGFDVYADATYTAEKFAATLRTDIGKADSSADLALGIGAYVSSTQIVKGAELTFGYAYSTSTGASTNDLLGGSFGAIDLGCKIKF